MKNAFAAIDDANNRPSRLTRRERQWLAAAWFREGSLRAKPLSKTQRRRMRTLEGLMRG